MLPVRKARMWISSFDIPSMGMTCHHSAAVTCTSHRHSQIRGRIQNERGEYVSQTEYYSDYSPVMAAVYVRALSSILTSTTTSARSSSSTTTELARMAAGASLHVPPADQKKSQPSPPCAERAAPVMAGAVAQAPPPEHKIYALRPDGLAYSLDDESEESFRTGSQTSKGASESVGKTIQTSRKGRKGRQAKIIGSKRTS